MHIQDGKFVLQTWLYGQQQLLHPSQDGCTPTFSASLPRTGECIGQFWEGWDCKDFQEGVRVGLLIFWKYPRNGLGSESVRCY